MELVEVLKSAVQAGATDVHFVIGRSPLMRVNGELIEIPGFSRITTDESKRLIYSVLYEEQRTEFEASSHLECSFSVSGLSRFRINALRGKNGVEAVLHVIEPKNPGIKRNRGSDGPPSAGQPVRPTKIPPGLHGGAAKDFPKD